MNPARVDAVVDLAYGVLIFVAVVLIVVLETAVGLAFGFGVLLSYVIHVGWKMGRFDPDWMTRTVEETVGQQVEVTVEETVGQQVEESVGQQVEEAVEESVGQQVEATVEESVGEAVEEKIEEAVEEKIEDDAEETDGTEDDETDPVRD